MIRIPPVVITGIWWWCPNLVCRHGRPWNSAKRFDDFVVLFLGHYSTVLSKFLCWLFYSIVKSFMLNLVLLLRIGNTLVVIWHGGNLWWQLMKRLAATQPAELQCHCSYSNGRPWAGLSNGAIFVKNIDVSKSYGRNATDQWTHQQNWHNNQPDIDEVLWWELKAEAGS